jgi:hypothetical protein
MRIDERKKLGDDREAMLGVVGRPDEGRAFGQVTPPNPMPWLRVLATTCLLCPRAFVDVVVHFLPYYSRAPPNTFPHCFPR